MSFIYQLFSTIPSFEAFSNTPGVPPGRKARVSSSTSRSSISITELFCVERSPYLELSLMYTSPKVFKSLSKNYLFIYLFFKKPNTSKPTIVGPSSVHLTFQTAVGRVIVIETVTPVQPLLQRATHQVFAGWCFPFSFAPYSPHVHPFFPFY